MIKKMSKPLRYDNRVVVVTGAGAGLGKEYALLFAKRGAQVVVNDLGGARNGEGSSSNAADQVVNEIKSNGGTAVADYNSVVEGDKIIQTALENFGRVDVIVNNAGILRDKSFPRIGDADWNLIFDVHVKGSFKTTQAAWPHFRKQNFGRIIMTSSNSGLYGNFGQANYSAAKMALVGLANTLAIEGSKYNIHCNVIVPTAASRLTEDIMPPDLFNELKPSLIAPVVAWLCHESCEENGSIIDSAAGWAAKCHIVRGEGSLLREKITDDVTPEAVQNNWNLVTNMEKASRLNSIQEATGSLMGYLENLRESKPLVSIERTSEGVMTSNFEFTRRDAIIYALGIGATLNNSDELKYLYESHEDFSCFPTYATIPGMVGIMNSDIIVDALPKKSLDYSRVLHGEQYLEILKPMPTEGKLKSQFSVTDVLDKKKGALVLVDFDCFDEGGEQVSHGQTQVFVVGAGNFNGKRSSDKAILPVEPPKRAPDFTDIVKTSVDQAALYRLSGDYNPLHIDPQFAVVAGFSQPILHGLASYGIAARQVLKFYGGSDPKNFKAIKARFSRPIAPGHTIRTDMWQQGNRIHFQSCVIETGNVILTGAYVDLVNVIPPNTRKPSPNLTSTTLAQKPTSAAPLLKSDPIFEAMKDQVSANIQKVKQVNGVFLYQITKKGSPEPASKWTLDFKKGEIYKGDPAPGVKIDTTITADDEDFADMASGKLNPQIAFMRGKLKIKGNIMLTQKLQTLMTQSKL